MRTPSPELPEVHEPPSEPENALPTSTAPSKLGREKRKRIHSRKYEESRALNWIPESQEVHKTK